MIGWTHKFDIASGAVGEDGFTYYTCKGECGVTKIAALFLPAQIATGDLVCRACQGEVARLPVHGPRTWQKVTEAQRTNFASASVLPHSKPSIPARFSRGGAVR